MEIGIFHHLLLARPAALLIITEIFAFFLIFMNMEGSFSTKHIHASSLIGKKVLADFLSFGIFHHIIAILQLFLSSHLIYDLGRLSMHLLRSCTGQSGLKLC